MFLRVGMQRRILRVLHCFPCLLLSCSTNHLQCSFYRCSYKFRSSIVLPSFRYSMMTVPRTTISARTLQRQVLPVLFPHMLGQSLVFPVHCNVLAPLPLRRRRHQHVTTSLFSSCGHARHNLLHISKTPRLFRMQYNV